MTFSQKRRATEAEFLTACWHARLHPAEVLEVWIDVDHPDAFEIVVKGTIDKINVTCAAKEQA